MRIERMKLVSIAVAAVVIVGLVVSLLTFGPGIFGPSTGPKRPAGTSSARAVGAPSKGAANQSNLPKLSVGDPVGQENVKADVFKVNQVGYLPSAQKIALVGATSADTFKVVDLGTWTSAYAGYLGEPVVDEESGDKLRTADFSALKTPGEYAVVIPGTGRSYPFRIADDVYDKLFKDAIRSYDELARMAPRAWHTLDALLKLDPSKRLDVTGGWPDAGDYGKYTPTAALTVGELLMLYELMPEKISKVGLDLPTNDKSGPDFLKVVRVELDWLLKMQRSDGAVYDKVTPEQFGPFSKSDADLGGTQYVYDISTPDTAMFAAVMARAARVYQPVDAQFSKRALAAAEKAWAFLEKNGEILPPPVGGTGGYFYASDESQRFWAAAELFKTTGTKKYDDYVRKHLAGSGELTIGALSWIDTRTMGLLTYYFTEKADKALKQDIKESLTTWADDMSVMVQTPINPYRVSLAVYEWASNKTALDNGVMLLVANMVSPKPVYVEAALDQLSYVLGRNAVNKAYVTGHGSDPVKDPHNRAMYASGKLVPGVLVGGPNKNAEHGYVNTTYGPKAYVDKMEAWCVNENSIEYNAPLVFLTGYFSTNGK
ncbi:MAG: glycoside hydrolase family 9 protein [Chloroflexi bacterium]|nr:glycoside hydrolase family 9 protein [Chloroflexota bacterium]